MSTVSGRGFLTASPKPSSRNRLRGSSTIWPPGRRESLARWSGGKTERHAGLALKAAPCRAVAEAPNEFGAREAAVGVLACGGSGLDEHDDLAAPCLDHDRQRADAGEQLDVLDGRRPLVTRRSGCRSGWRAWDGAGALRSLWW